MNFVILKAFLNDENIILHLFIIRKQRARIFQRNIKFEVNIFRSSNKSYKWMLWWMILSTKQTDATSIKTTTPIKFLRLTAILIQHLISGQSQILQYICRTFILSVRIRQSTFVSTLNIYQPLVCSIQDSLQSQ